MSETKYSAEHPGCVILHIDMDCFFAQVAQKLDPSLTGKPIAVHQHQDIICVNYEARKFGLCKHLTPEEAKKILPEVQLVSVPKGYGSKVSYKVYQEASDQIAALLHTFTPVIEKASIDEFYMDITDLVARRLKREIRAQDHNSQAAISWKGIVYAGTPSVMMPGDEQMHEGAEVAHEIRSALTKTLGFTASIGIANNKMLARLASTINKPDQQTVLLRRYIPNLLAETRISKIPQFGMKVGKDKSAVLADLGAVTCLDLQDPKFTLEELQRRFGQTAGEFLYLRCRGIDNDVVKPKAPPKSIMSSMSLTPFGPKVPELRKIMSYICGELVDRLRSDFICYQRKPSNFSLHYRNVNEKEKALTIRLSEIISGSKSDNANPDNGIYSTNTLVSLCMKVFLNATKDTMWNLRWIGIIVSGFERKPIDNAIAKFFSQSTPTQTTQASHECKESTPCTLETENEDMESSTVSTLTSTLPMSRQKRNRPGETNKLPATKKMKQNTLMMYFLPGAQKK